MQCRHLAGLALAALTFTGLAVRADDKPAKPASEAEQRLDKMKSLAGEWTLDGKVAAIYRVVSAGSAVMEDIFPGSEHEMITMYTVDGDDLVLTHYCAIGNQPHMKAKKGGPANEIHFEFAGGANVDPKSDMHMHDATFTFKDADHVTAEWVLWANGEKKETKILAYARSKK